MQTRLLPGVIVSVFLLGFPVASQSDRVDDPGYFELAGSQPCSEIPDEEEADGGTYSCAWLNDCHLPKKRVKVMVLGRVAMLVRWSAAPTSDIREILSK